ncbi:MAG: FliI/YscN family ATPase [Pseudomonadota bacterium]
MDVGITEKTNQLESIKLAISNAILRPKYGRVIEVQGPVIRAAFDGAKMGDLCKVTKAASGHCVLCQVIALRDDVATLSPFGDAVGFQIGDIIQPSNEPMRVACGTAILGRVLDGLGQPLDGIALPPNVETRLVKSPAPPALKRPIINAAFYTGLKCIDGLVTLGKGQRIGVFGAPGTGKSSLLAAITKHCDADIIVIGIVGERGREVREFLEHHLPKEKRSRVVVVAATSDKSAMERVNSAHIATSLAEGFRDQGASVLLLIDSLTRVARALREVGLAAGEAPTRRGYPASVYSALPELIERAGNSANGTMTAIYSILVEGDGQNDPIAEETKSLTDGHLVLSQDLAEAGQFPAIDPVQSLSRVMHSVTTPDHQALSEEVRALMARYREIEILLQVGEYKAGGDPLADKAVSKIGEIREFLRQKSDETQSFEQTLEKLRQLVS